MADQTELEKKKCKQCELPLLVTDRYCPFCGRRQPNPIPWERRLAKGLTLFLLIVMGLPAALAGCCGVLAAGSVGGDWTPVVIPFAVFAFAFWLFLRAWRK